MGKARPYQPIPSGPPSLITSIAILPNVVEPSYGQRLVGACYSGKPACPKQPSQLEAVKGEENSREHGGLRYHVRTRVSVTVKRKGYWDEIDETIGRQVSV